MKFRSIKGTYDVLPNVSNKWKIVESHIHQYLTRCGYNEIRTPIFENTDLFKRSVELFTFVILVCRIFI